MTIVDLERAWVRQRFEDWYQDVGMSSEDDEWLLVIRWEEEQNS